ncbi:hypothetical protein [Arthrobacter sp. TMN-50]
MTTKTVTITIKTIALNDMPLTERIFSQLDRVSYKQWDQFQATGRCKPDMEYEHGLHIVGTWLPNGDIVRLVVPSPDSLRPVDAKDIAFQEEKALIEVLHYECTRLPLVILLPDSAVSPQ